MDYRGLQRAIDVSQCSVYTYHMEKLIRKLRKTVKKQLESKSLNAVARESGVDVAVLWKWLNADKRLSVASVDKLLKWARLRIDVRPMP